MNEQKTNWKRRSFLQSAAQAALFLPVIGLAVLESSACSGAKSALAESGAAPVPWKINLVPENEPGEPLIISGTIYAPDRRTPLSGIGLWVYQTDATGHYSTLSGSGGDNRNTRIHGFMKTNSKGRYEFRTIKPAPYPGRTNPAHIHAYVSGPEYPEYWIDDFLFDGDPYITNEMKQKFGDKGNLSSILRLTRDADGTWRGLRDIAIERCAKNCTGR